jgi:hypothetical protein
MVDQFEDEGVIDFDEPINGVIDDFSWKHAQIPNVFSILKFTMFSLIGMRVLVFYFRKKKIYELKTKLRLAIFITLLISSYLYVEYSVKIVNNQPILHSFPYNLDVNSFLVKLIPRLLHKE